MNLLTGIRGIAFDLDGTLVDSVPDLTVAIDLMLHDLQYPNAGEARVREWIGNGADTLVKRALTWAQEGFVPDIVKVRAARARFDQHYAENLCINSRIYPGVIETLSSLKAQGLSLAVVTNKPTAFVAPLLQALHLDLYFALAIGGDDVVVRKPHPAGLYQVLGTFGLRPHELLVVGDSENDINAAKAAGCPSVGLTYGYNYDEPIAHSEPDWVLDHLSGLLNVLSVTHGLP
ncbi:MAG: phosphoglycolate phosphatase [Plesiomonas sp.]|uniref:phosphoglycolate phosphatase n=1 Tax=Plesiomonas sp. TaxID=2486279 RepID=UPI003F2BCB0D